jgi:hypothetical protein
MTDNNLDYFTKTLAKTTRSLYTVYIDINSITVGGIKIERMEGSNVAR